MGIEEILRSTVLMLNSMHILASDAETMVSVMQNLMTVIAALEKVRKEAETNDDQDGQGQDV